VSNGIPLAVVERQRGVAYRPGVRVVESGPDVSEVLPNSPATQPPAPRPVYLEIPPIRIGTPVAPGKLRLAPEAAKRAERKKAPKK
jgi:hypothetical protein